MTTSNKRSSIEFFPVPEEPIRYTIRKSDDHFGDPTVVVVRATSEEDFEQALFTIERDGCTRTLKQLDGDLYGERIAADDAARVSARSYGASGHDSRFSIWDRIWEAISW